MPAPTRRHRPCPRDVATAPVGLLGSLSQSSEGAVGVGGIDAVEVEVPLVVDGHRHRAHPGEERAHLVGGVRHRGIEHGVARRVAQRQHPRQRRHHLLGADARDHVVDGERTAEAAFHPSHRGLAEAGAADGGRVPGRGGRGGSERLERDRGHRVDRRADRGVEDAARHRGGGGPDRSQAIVRIRRRDEGRRIGDGLGACAQANCLAARSSRCGRGRGPSRCTWRSRRGAATRPRSRRRRRSPRGRC